MSYIMACQADASCTLEEEHEDEEDEGDHDKLWALKMGLAVAFLAITIVASFVPVLFKGLEHYSVRAYSLFQADSGCLLMLGTWAHSFRARAKHGNQLVPRK